jgi:SSS family solute:Na+ symporter
MDIYKQYINKNADDRTTVNERISGAVALLIAVMAPPLRY